MVLTVIAGLFLVVGLSLQLRREFQAQRERQENERARRQAAEQARRERQENERARRQVEQEQAQRKRQENERARRKAEEQAERGRRINTAKIALTKNIDLYIRTRKKFDSRDPVAFRCNVGSILQDQDIVEDLADLSRLLVEANYAEISLYDFIAEEESFFLHDTTSMVGVQHLTPFQGDLAHRVFGYFECGVCQREWQSAATYTNGWQKCKSCEVKCYPFQQHPLKQSEHHDIQRCQRCLQLGRLCMPRQYYAI
jgi:flagellar biosynthesis GTPase FlhF